MISKIEQEKLNNCLEYINPNYYVIITSSDKSKIAKSIITRCKTIELTTPSIEQQLDNITRICNLENIDLTKKQLVELIEFSRLNPRTVLKNLTDIKNCGTSKFYSIVRDNDEEFRNCLRFLTELKYGTANVIDFIETLEDVYRFYYSLPNFLYSLIKIKYGKSVYQKHYEKMLKEVISLYTETVIIEALELLDTQPKSIDTAKQRLFRTAFKLNTSLFNSIDERDEINTMKHLSKEEANVFGLNTEPTVERKSGYNSASFVGNTGVSLDDL